MNTNVLNTEKVLAVGSVLGDVELDDVLVPRAPSIAAKVLRGVADACLVDLEPVTVTLVGLSGAGSLGEVGQAGTGVLHGSADSELEADLGTGLDLGGLGLASVGEGALVADDVVQVRGRVVTDVLPLDGVVLGRTSAGTNVLVAGSLLAVDDELVEEVVTLDGASHRGDNSGGRELHFDGIEMSFS